jgi:hypothetical protein
MGFVTALLLTLAVSPEMVATARIKEGHLTRSVAHRVTGESPSTLPTQPEDFADNGPRYKKYSQIKLILSSPLQEKDAAKKACLKAFREFVCDPVINAAKKNNEAFEASLVKEDLEIQKRDDLCRRGCGGVWCGTRYKVDGSADQLAPPQRHEKMCRGAQLEQFFPKFAELQEPCDMSEGDC